MDQRNGSIDVFRFFAACIVFFGHSLYANYFPSLLLLSTIGRWALPFFFLVSGYYFYRSYAVNSFKAFLPVAQSLLTITLFDNLVFLIFNLLTQDSLKPLVSYFTLLIGVYFHLWYLNSLIIGYVVLWFILRFKLAKWLPHLIVLTLILTLLLTPYQYLFGLKPHPIQARSLLSVPLLCLGFFIAKQKLDIGVSRQTSYWLIAIGTIFQLIETLSLPSPSQDLPTVSFFAGTLGLALGVFSLALTLPISHHNVLSRYGRRYSLPLYLYHPITIYAFNKLLKALQIDASLYWVSPILALIATLALFTLLDRFSPALFRILNGSFSRPKLESRLHSQRS